jgi:hypothetical protein
MNALALYLAAVLAVVAPQLHEGRRDSIAQDVAAVVLADHEERAFPDDENGQQTGLLLLALAHHETGRSWATWIDDGSCNNPAWREAHWLLLRHGDCDGGHAWGMWQVHAPGNDDTVGRGYVLDRKAGIRAALLIARASLKSGARLCHYSGEAFPHCRLADTRLETAQSWITRFPYPQAGE